RFVKLGQNPVFQEAPPRFEALSHHIIAGEHHHVEGVVDDRRLPGAVILEQVERRSPLLVHKCGAPHFWTGTNPLRGNSVVTTSLRNRQSSGIGVRSREADAFAGRHALAPNLRLTACAREKRTSSSTQPSCARSQEQS